MNYQDITSSDGIPHPRCQAYTGGPESTNNPTDFARMVAIPKQESGDGLNAITFLFLDPSLQIHAALQPKFKIYKNHQCVCGKTEDSQGFHGLFQDNTSDMLN